MLRRLRNYTLRSNQLTILNVLLDSVVGQLAQHVRDRVQLGLQSAPHVVVHGHRSIEGYCDILSEVEIMSSMRLAVQQHAVSGEAACRDAMFPTNQVLFKVTNALRSAEDLATHTFPVRSL